MECPYCGCELKYHDFYGRGSYDEWGMTKVGYIKSGDIYKCDNEECEYDGHFYTRNGDSELYEGYPC